VPVLTVAGDANCETVNADFPAEVSGAENWRQRRYAHAVPANEIQ